MNLEKFSKAYYAGKPLISDAHYDALVDVYGEEDNVGTADTIGIKHYYRMYSLKKVYDNEGVPTDCAGHKLIKSIKLDGSAISLLYVDGFLVLGLMRGDGIHAQRNITDKVLLMDTVKKEIDSKERTQITGEVVFRGESDNIRNQAAGSLGLDDNAVFKEREKELDFIGYSIYPGKNTYTEDMDYLQKQGFKTVLNIDSDTYLTDGTVYRINNNSIFYDLGYTAKHPRGAYAHKKRGDEACNKTNIVNVLWETGASGKVTPTCIFNEIDLGGAKTTRATLNNAGYVEKLDIDIDDEILVSRAGHVIPKIIANITKDIYLYD